MALLADTPVVLAAGVFKATGSNPAITSLAMSAWIESTTRSSYNIGKASAVSSSSGVAPKVADMETNQTTHSGTQWLSSSVRVMAQKVQGSITAAHIAAGSNGTGNTPTQMTKYAGFYRGSVGDHFSALPINGQTMVAPSSSVAILFDRAIAAGSGAVTLGITGGASKTVTYNMPQHLGTTLFVVGSTLHIVPDADFPAASTVSVSVAAGVVTNGGVASEAVSGYSFGTVSVDLTGPVFAAGGVPCCKLCSIQFFPSRVVDGRE